MARPPISVCLIVKNEEAQLGACLASVRPHVSQIVVVDTGSTDKTPHIAKQYADRFEFYFDANDDRGEIVDFSKARQHSFSLATEPWIYWLDGDDELVGGERLGGLVKHCEFLRKHNDAVTLRNPYEYAHNDRGECICLLPRERMVPNPGPFRWRYPVHEILAAPSNAQVFNVPSDSVRVIHRRDPKRKSTVPRRNLRILQRWLLTVSDEDRSRCLYYLAREYGDNGEYDNAIEYFQQYLRTPGGFDDERCTAMLRIVDHAFAKQDIDLAIEWAFKATTVREDWPEPYFALCRAFYQRAQHGGNVRDWQRSVHFGKLGLAAPPVQSALFVDDVARIEIHRWLNYAMSRVGDIEGALRSVSALLEKRPDEKDMLNNQRIYRSLLARKSIEEALPTALDGDDPKDWAADLEKRLATTLSPPAPDVVEMVSASAPVAALPPAPAEPPSHTAAPLPPVSPSKAPLPKGRPKDGKLDVVFYVGRGPRPWNASTIANGGVGGSEIMVAEMAQRLAERGHAVKVIGDCRRTVENGAVLEDYEGTIGGVEYIDVARFEWARGVECDVLVASRRPRVVDDSYGIKAKLRLLWVHDVHCWDELTHARALRFDRILALSNWHRQTILERYPYVRPDQVWVTRNAIDLMRFDQTVERKPHRAIYSSSPDRGMEVAVRIWPKVRDSVPDAELHIFYGFEVWEMAAKSRGEHGQVELIARLKQLLREHEKHGVRYHGFVKPSQLAAEFLASGVWTYPTWFTETSCITAMEAQAAGCRIVTSPIAALNETVGDRGVLIPGEWISEDYQRPFIEATVGAMLRDGDEDRVALQRYARRNFGFDELVQTWEEEFSRLLIEAAERLLPPYHSPVNLAESRI